MSHPCEEQAEGTASASRPPAWPELGLPGSQMQQGSLLPAELAAGSWELEQHRTLGVCEAA